MKIYELHYKHEKHVRVLSWKRIPDKNNRIVLGSPQLFNDSDVSVSSPRYLGGLIDEDEYSDGRRRQILVYSYYNLPRSLLPSPIAI